MEEDQQIEGLPEGATVRPLQPSQTSATDPSQVEGMPEGATLRSIAPPAAHTAASVAPSPAATKPPITTRPRVTKGAVAPPAPKQDMLTEADQNYALPPEATLALKAARGVRGLYHGVMGDEETDASKGQTTTASPEAANAGFTPEHLGYKTGEMVHGIGKFAKEAVQDIAGNSIPVVVPDKGDKAGFADPKAHTLVAKYVTAPSQAERDASQAEMQKYFETQGPEAAGHAISAFLHGTLGEYVPAIGPLAMSIESQAQKGDLGGALAQIASLYAFEKGTGKIKTGIQDRINAKVEDLTKTPEVKQAEANVETLGKEREAAEAKHQAALAEHNKYQASHAQGIGSPEKIVKEVNKAKEALDEAEAHHELAKEDLVAKKAAQPTIPQRVGGAVGRTAAKVLPTPAPAPEVPTEAVEAAPVLSKLGEQAPAKPAMAPINVKTPGQVQPETFPQEPTLAPRPSYGRISLPNEQGTMGAPKQLTEGTPEGPQIPKGGLPKINLPEEKPVTAPKPERGNVKALTTDKKGNVVDTEDTIEGRIGKLLQDALKPENIKPKLPENYNPDTDQIGVREKLAREEAVEKVGKEKEEKGKTESRANERRVADEDHEGGERRQGERRVLNGINENTFQESAFGKGGEKRIDTDAYAKATEQARKELGPDATKEAVIARRNELVSPEAKGGTGDVGEQARKTNPEPTRAETKAALPKEEPTGYTAKKEEVVPAGVEGREPAKSASEYHPAVEQKVNELSDDNLRKLAQAHGLNPDEYDFKARDERRHRTERDQLAKDVTEQIGEDEKINLGRAAESAEKEPGFANRDQSAKARADRAAKLFPRLRGAVDEFGNPKVSGGNQSALGEFTPKEVEKEAEAHQGNRQPGQGPAKDYTWKQDDKFPVSKLEGTKDEWAKWFADEKEMSKDGSRSPNYYEDMEKDWVKKPFEHLVAVRGKDGNYQIWDGAHRLAISKIHDMETAPVFVGEPKTNTVGTEEAAKSDTEHFANAKKELGANASISDVAKRAQEMKDAAKGTSFKQQRALDEAAYKKADLKRVVSDYAKTEGLPEVKDNKIEVDPRSKEIARAYDDMKHDPSNPEVKKSYSALIDDAKKQWDALTKAGIKLEPQDEDPYKSYDEMKKDFDDNKRLKVFRGGNELPEDHPLAQVDPKTGETYNVMFRAVHDAIGHLLHDNDFSEKGESNAFDTHRQTMSKDAIPAMTTETKAQVASYFDKGEFPEQKAGILPDKYTEDAPDPKTVLDHLKSGKDYALLTAENPNNERATPEQNAQKNQEMKVKLEKMGYKPTPIEGHVKDVEGQKENSFFVPDISPKDAAKVSREFGQASVMTKQGIHDLAKDTVHPSTGVLEGDEAAKQDYHSTVAGKPFSVSVDFNKEEEPSLPSVSGGSGKLPTGDALIKKYGESNGDPKDLTFILPDGRGVANTGIEHDHMLGGKTNEKVPPRERFIAEGNIRVRPRQGAGGREVSLSIPESGVTSDQLKYIQKMSPQLRSGAVMIEVGKPGGGYKAIPYGEASPEQIETVIRGLGPVLNDKGAPVDWYGNPTVSGGSQSAGTGKAKTTTTPEELQKSLPENAQKHLTQEEKDSITTTATGKPRTAGTDKFISNMEKIPTVQEYTDIAQQGEGARKWYSRSTAAFDAMHEEAPDYFKEGDKEKFMGVLAGSSPQQSVAMNLRETLGFWKEWHDAGRPKFDLDKWKEFGDKAKEDWEEDGSPRARGLAKGASMHWDYAPTGPKWKSENLLLKNLTLPETKVPNIIKALNGEQMWPDLTKNAAFKAPSFAENLRKWIGGESTGTKNVTNDSWMGLFGGIDKSALSKPENYHPLSVATRAAAEALGWEPEEAQAAIWSFTQALTEKGVEDPEIVRHYSEDFKDLLANDLETRDTLKGLGVNLDQLDSKLDAIGEKPKVSGRSTPTTAHSVGQLRSRIEDARGKGAIPEPKSVQGNLFRENPAFEQRHNPGEGHVTQPRDEATRFNPDEFKDEESGLTKLGEKKSRYGKIR